MPKLSGKLIQEAKNGSPSRLRELASSLQPNNYVVDALEACTAPLVRDDGVSHLPLSTSELDLRIAALTCLNRVAEVCSQGVKRPLKESTIARLLEILGALVEGIATTTVAILQAGDPDLNVLGDVANSLTGMLSLDPRLETILRSSSDIMRLTLIIWIPHATTDGRLMIDLNHQGVMKWTMKLLEGPHNLWDPILDSRVKLKMFCNTLLIRVAQLGGLCQDPRFSTDTVVDYAKTIMKITELVRRNPAILARLRKEGYLRSWTRTILALHPRFKRHEMMLPLVRSQLNNICAPYSPPLKNLAEALSGGLMAVVLDLLRQTPVPPRGSREKRHGLNLCNLFLPYVWYPRGLLTLGHSLGKTPNIGDIEDEIRGKRHLALDWIGWMGLQFNGKQALEGINKASCTAICDNETHRTTCVNDNELTIQGFKMCSGCHSVCYCSRTCQKEDWKRRHRNECSDMRVSYLDRRKRKIHYTPTDRLYQIILLEEIYDTEAEEAAKMTAKAYPGYHPRELISFRNCTGGTSRCWSRVDTNSNRQIHSRPRVYIRR
ncbi:hypothetical protein CC2G_004316 [Coprinopsis cinerea AmutBmut pab1-1]|nr:hypothetical protein CC2G_004316 [Coprinopsis cinerea AmutBmut pab1-1]